MLCSIYKSKNQNCCRMTAEDAFFTYYKNSHQSQPELANKLNVSQTTIHNWLSGKNRIPMEFYDRVAMLCGVRLSDILPDQWKVMLDKDSFDTENYQF
jgi:transcriptional regulator with XRE-family HTH domain